MLKLNIKKPYKVLKNESSATAMITDSADEAPGAWCWTTTQITLPGVHMKSNKVKK